MQIISVAIIIFSVAVIIALVCLMMYAYSQGIYKFIPIHLFLIAVNGAIICSLIR